MLAQPLVVIDSQVLTLKEMVKSRMMHTTLGTVLQLLRIMNCRSLWTVTKAMKLRHLLLEGKL